jgi:hypothetical protein
MEFATTKRLNRDFCTPRPNAGPFIFNNLTSPFSQNTAKSFVALLLPHVFPVSPLLHYSYKKMGGTPHTLRSLGERGPASSSPFHLKEHSVSKTNPAAPNSSKSDIDRKKAIPPPGIRCIFTDLAGRQCRALALRPKGKGASRSKSGLCLTHATEERQLREAEEVAEELLSESRTLDTALGLNKFFRRLIDLTASARISKRDAALLTYQASLLLQTVAPVKNEVVDAYGAAALKLIHRNAMNLSYKINILDPKQDANPDAKPASGPTPAPAPAPQPASQTQ